MSPNFPLGARGLTVPCRHKTGAGAGSAICSIAANPEQSSRKPTANNGAGRVKSHRERTEIVHRTHRDRIEKKEAPGYLVGHGETGHFSAVEPRLIERHQVIRPHDKPQGFDIIVATL